MAGKQVLDFGRGCRPLQGTDLVFAAADNDLVVPTEGCWAVDGAAGFPVD